MSAQPVREAGVAARAWRAGARFPGVGVRLAVWTHCVAVLRPQGSPPAPLTG